MIVHICEDEWYPVYSTETWDEHVEDFNWLSRDEWEAEYTAREIPDDLEARIATFFKRFGELQTWLKEYENKPEHHRKFPL